MQNRKIERHLDNPTILLALILALNFIGEIHERGGCLNVSVPSYFEINTCSTPVAKQPTSIKESEE